MRSELVPFFERVAFNDWSRVFTEWVTEPLTHFMSLSRFCKRITLMTSACRLFKKQILFSCPVSDPRDRVYRIPLIKNLFLLIALTEARRARNTFHRYSSKQVTLSTALVFIYLYFRWGIYPMRSFTSGKGFLRLRQFASSICSLQSSVAVLYISIRSTYEASVGEIKSQEAVMRSKHKL